MIRKLFNVLSDNTNTVSGLNKDYGIDGLFPHNDFITDCTYKEAKKYKNVTIWKWIVHGRTVVECSLKVYSKKEDYPEDKMNYLMQCISFIISFAKHNHPLTVHFVPLNHKKRIRKNQYRIGRSNVNSGACGGGHVYVWRLEECFKVLLHECIHHLGFSNLQLSNELLTHYIELQ